MIDKSENNQAFNSINKNLIDNGPSDEILQNRVKVISSLNNISKLLNWETSTIHWESIQFFEPSSPEKKVEDLNQEKNLTDNYQTIHFCDSLNSIITKTFLEIIEIQHKLDNEEEIKRTPGRPSNFKYMKSTDLKQWIFNLFAKKLLS